MASLSVSNGVHSNVESFNFQESIRGLSEKIKVVSEKVGNFAVQHILKPCAIGIGVGVAEFSVNLIFISLLSAVSEVGKIGADPIKAVEYSKAVLASFWQTAVIAPVLEEIVFRVVIQGAFDFITDKIFGDKEVEIFSHKIKLAALVSIVATSVLFGLAHYGSGLGLAQVISATIGGLVYGVLRHKYNPLASMSAHITNNSIILLIILAFSKK